MVDLPPPAFPESRTRPRWRRPVLFGKVPLHPFGADRRVIRVGMNQHPELRMGIRPNPDIVDEAAERVDLRLRQIVPLRQAIAAGGRLGEPRKEARTGFFLCCSW